MSNLEDYTQQPKMIAEYYSLMPDDMKDKYTVEEVQGDFVMTAVMAFFGGTAFSGLFAELPHDNDLWGLFEVWPLRFAATLQACDALSVLKNLEVLVDEEVIPTGPAQLARLGLVLFLAENPNQRPELAPRLEITLRICVFAPGGSPGDCSPTRQLQRRSGFRRCRGERSRIVSPFLSRF